MKDFNVESLSIISLRTQLALVRIGSMNAIVFLLCMVGAGAWLWLVPKLHAQADAQKLQLLLVKKSLQAAEHAVLTVQRSETEVRMTGFYEALGERRYAEQQIKTLFAVANRTGLSLDQAEYKSAFDKNSNTNTFQIILPVKGPYPAIREFCEKTLLAIPFASLDEMNFKRDTIANRTLEAKLRFTLYLADSPINGKKMAGL